MTTTLMTVNGNEQGHRGYRSLVLVSLAFLLGMTCMKHLTQPYLSTLCSGARCFAFTRHVCAIFFICAGENSVIKRAIIDDNVSIGRNVKITNKDNIEEADCTDSGYVIQHGIVVVLKGATIKDGTEI